MKNALFVAYYFPPSGGGGVKRPTKFVKYLHRYDWKTVILTVTEDSYFLHDNKLQKDLPYGLDILRVKPVISKKKTDQFRAKSLKINEVNQKNIKGIRNKILWKIRDWCFIPDVQIHWVFLALPKAIKAVKKNKIKVVWTKCPPYSMLVLGALIKRMTNVFWIIDLADPWTTASYNYFPNEKIKKLNEWLEKKLFQKADKIVTVAQNIVDDYYTKYPDLPADKFCIIPNGFDVDDYKSIDGQENNKFTICYTGRIDLAGRNPTNFLKGVKLFIDENPGTKEDFNVIFVGGGGEYWDDIVTELKLTDIVKFTGNVSYDLSIQYQLQSNLLLLIGGGSKYEQTGKIFEYLYANKPILGLIQNDCPAAEIITNTNTGIVISNDNVNEINDAIADFYFKYKKGEDHNSSRNQVEINKYDWNQLGKNLVDIFDELIK